MRFGDVFIAPGYEKIDTSLSFTIYILTEPSQSQIHLQGPRALQANQLNPLARPLMIILPGHGAVFVAESPSRPVFVIRRSHLHDPGRSNLR